MTDGDHLVRTLAVAWGLVAAGFLTGWCLAFRAGAARVARRSRPVPVVRLGRPQRTWAPTPDFGTKEPS